MKDINFPMLLLATSVIMMFVLVGMAIALKSVWLILLFTVLGFGLMGIGLTIKRRR